MKKSESIKNLAAALSKFQSEVKNPTNSAKNPFLDSKYAPLNEILNDVRPILAKHGLSIIQSTGSDGENITITTVLLHSSGEWIETEPLILQSDKQKGRSTAQAAGSAITYGRRYSLSAVLGISSEDDTDGNSSDKDKNTDSKNNKSSSNRQNGKNDKNNDNNRKAFFAKLKEWTESNGLDAAKVKEKAREALRESYKIDSCSKLTPADWKKIVQNFDRFTRTLEEKYDLAIELPDDSEVLQNAK